VKLREQVLANDAARAAAAAAPAAKEEDGAKRIALLRGHRSWVLSAAFSPDRNLLATGGVDGTVHVFGFSSSLPWKDQVGTQPHNSEVHAVAFGPDNKHFASASGALDGTVMLWAVDAAGIESKKRLPGHQAPVEALAFTPDGKVLASGGADGVIRLWEVAGTDTRERKGLRGHLGTIQCLTVTPDSRLLISGSHDGTVRVWNHAKWNPEQAVLPGHYGNVTALACSPDGKVLASGGSDAAILLWDLETSDNTRPRAVLEGNISAVRLLLFLPSEHKLVSVSDRGRAILWDLNTNKPEREWAAPGMMIGCVALTFDGRYLAVGKNDGTVAVFRQGPKR
jgi:WD40 repeat protein